MHSAGVQTERMEISWDLVEPQKGQFDYALTDRKVLAARAGGIDVLALIVRSPGWAAQHPGQPFSAPRDPADYAAFATTLVARYGPGGALWREHPEVAPRPIRAWQVWNEPNLEVYWSEQPFMRGYARLLDAAYAAIKQSRSRCHSGRWPAWPTSRGATSSGSSPRVGRSCASTWRRCTRSAGGRQTP